MRTRYITPATDIIHVSPAAILAASTLDDIVSTDTGGGEEGGGTTDPVGGDILDSNRGATFENALDIYDGDSEWVDGCIGVPFHHRHD